MDNPIIDWSAAIVAVEGETVSGDQYLVRPFPDGVLVAAVDGLGHGPEAEAAATVAISALKADPSRPLISLVQACHAALRTMRGAVMSLASFNRTDHSMTWLGIGNVEGRLIRPDTESGYTQDILLLRGGIVGHNLPTLIVVTVPIKPGDTLIFASDGIRSDFAEDLEIKVPPQQLVHNIINRSAKHTDDSLVVVARYL